MPSRLLQGIVFLVAIGLGVTSAQAQRETLCAAVANKDKSEGAMPISEKSFTEQAARRELRKLNKLLGPDGLTVDSVAWETSFVYIEGWYLKRQAIEAKKRGDTPSAISDFCTFLQDRAYVHH